MSILNTTQSLVSKALYGNDSSQTTELTPSLVDNITAITNSTNFTSFANNTIKTISDGLALLTNWIDTSVTPNNTTDDSNTGMTAGEIAAAAIGITATIATGCVLGKKIYDNYYKNKKGYNETSQNDQNTNNPTQTV